jgi:hypothetical protein
MQQRAPLLFLPCDLNDSLQRAETSHNEAYAVPADLAKVLRSKCVVARLSQFQDELYECSMVRFRTHEIRLRTDSISDR